MKKVTAVGKAMKVLSFYRWAFGDLTESDSDVGILAEYLVGDILGCLPPTRKDQAPFDLVMKDGTTIEVKCVTHKYDPKRGRAPYYRWDVSTQSDALKGKRAIADVWLFLVVSFPRGASRTPRAFQAFDLRHWSCYMVSGERLRTAGCSSYVSESTLRRLGVEPFAVATLGSRFKELRPGRRALFKTREKRI